MTFSPLTRRSGRHNNHRRVPGHGLNEHIGKAGMDVLGNLKAPNKIERSTKVNGLTEVALDDAVGM